MFSLGYVVRVCTWEHFHASRRISSPAWISRNQLSFYQLIPASPRRPPYLHLPKQEMDAGPINPKDRQCDELLKFEACANNSLCMDFVQKEGFSRFLNAFETCKKRRDDSSVAEKEGLELALKSEKEALNAVLKSK